MKKLFCLLMSLLLISCTPKMTTVAEAIREIDAYIEGNDSSDKYDLDERIKYIQMFQLDADTVIHLNNETGLLSIKCTPKENVDGTLTCSVSGIYVDNYKNIGFGWIEKADMIKEFLGNDTTFTLYINENNVVTSDDWPTLV